MAVSKAVLRVYSYIGQHPLTLNDAILRNADVLDRHFNLYILALFSIILIVFWAPEINGHLVPQARAQHISWGRIRHRLITPVFHLPHTLQHFSSSSNLHHTVLSPSVTFCHTSSSWYSFSLVISTFSLIVFHFSASFNNLFIYYDFSFFLDYCSVKGVQIIDPLFLLCVSGTFQGFPEQKSGVYPQNPYLLIYFYFCFKRKEQPISIPPKKIISSKI